MIIDQFEVSGLVWFYSREKFSKLRGHCRKAGWLAGCLREPKISDHLSPVRKLMVSPLPSEIGKIYVKCRVSHLPWEMHATKLSRMAGTNLPFDFPSRLAQSGLIREHKYGTVKACLLAAAREAKNMRPRVFGGKFGVSSLRWEMRKIRGQQSSVANARDKTLEDGWDPDFGQEREIKLERY